MRATAAGCWWRMADRAGRAVAAAHVAERAARRAGRERQGRRRHTGTPHAHTRSAHTTPAPEERHYALSQPSLNEHTARHPPLGTNSIRERCCYDGRRRPHQSFHYMRRERCAPRTRLLQGRVNYQSDR